MDEAAVQRLIAKLRRFVADDLEADERAVLAALLAPAVAAAYDDAEVAGFGVTDLPPLPVGLTAVLRRSGIRVVGLDEPPR